MDSIAEALQNAPAGLSDYVLYLNDLLGGVNAIENPTEVFHQAFRFFEAHAGADLGVPGPLVHFLERFYPQYIDELCASVARKPTTYTVWMLNRVLNVELPQPTRERLVALLRTVAANSVTEPDVRQQAERFLERQR